MYRTKCFIIAVIAAFLLLAGCSTGNGDVGLSEDLEEIKTLDITREGMTEQLDAFKTQTPSGLTMYLLPQFMLAEDEGFDILFPKPEENMTPVSLTISNNDQAISSAEAALEKAVEYYPDVEFGDVMSFDYLTGNMEEGIIVYGILNDSWVACIGMKGETGTISAWGQGDMETAEGSQVLLFNQLGTVIK